MKKISMAVVINTPTDHKCPRIELASIMSDASPILRFEALFFIITLKEAAIVKYKLWKIQIQKLRYLILLHSKFK
jgi:hypothetical protein